MTEYVDLLQSILADIDLQLKESSTEHMPPNMCSTIKINALKHTKTAARASPGSVASNDMYQSCDSVKRSSPEKCRSTSQKWIGVLCSDPNTPLNANQANRNMRLPTSLPLYQASCPSTDTKGSRTIDSSDDELEFIASFPIKKRARNFSFQNGLEVIKENTIPDPYDDMAVSRRTHLIGPVATYEHAKKEDTDRLSLQCQQITGLTQEETFHECKNEEAVFDRKVAALFSFDSDPSTFTINSEIIGAQVEGSQHCKDLQSGEDTVKHERWSSNTALCEQTSTEKNDAASLCSTNTSEDGGNHVKNGVHSRTALLPSQLKAKPLQNAIKHISPQPTIVNQIDLQASDQEGEDQCDDMEPILRNPASSSTSKSNLRVSFGNNIVHSIARVPDSVYESLNLGTDSESDSEMDMDEHYPRFDLPKFTRSASPTPSVNKSDINFIAMSTNNSPAPSPGPKQSKTNQASLPDIAHPTFSSRLWAEDGSDIDIESNTDGDPREQDFIKSEAELSTDGSSSERDEHVEANHKRRKSTVECRGTVQHKPMLLQGGRNHLHQTSDLPTSTSSNPRSSLDYTQPQPIASNTCGKSTWISKLAITHYPYIASNPNTISTPLPKPPADTQQQQKPSQSIKSETVADPPPHPSSAIPRNGNNSNVPTNTRARARREKRKRSKARYRAVRKQHAHVQQA